MNPKPNKQLIDKIINKKFKATYNNGGYHPEDVDQFIDELVIEIETLITKLEHEVANNKALADSNASLKTKTSRLQTTLSEKENEIKSLKESGYQHLINKTQNK